MMKHDYVYIQSEVKELEKILTTIPEEDVIERISFEERLASARKLLDSVIQRVAPEKIRLTFQGEQVKGTYGIAAFFGAKATELFSDMVLACTASLNENLNNMGPIPEKKGKNQLLITGVAVGSFGFELELPSDDEVVQEPLFEEKTKAEEAVEQIQTLMKLAAMGDDDDITELVDTIHPRAVKKVSEFLNYLVQHKSICALDYKNKAFKFKDVTELEFASSRLEESNIHETEKVFYGCFLGVLPTRRTFEFQLENGEVLSGKISPMVDNVDDINITLLNKKIEINVQEIRVGMGKARYRINELPVA